MRGGQSIHMEHTTLFFRFGVALAIGFLVGLQREYARDPRRGEIPAGERTLALMGLGGCAAAMAADLLAVPWLFALVVLPFWALVVVAYAISAQRGDSGLTSETAAILVTLAGALCYWGRVPLAVALGVATTVLLSVKVELEAFVRRLSRDDVY